MYIKALKKTFWNLKPKKKKKSFEFKNSVHKYINREIHISDSNDNVDLFRGARGEGIQSAA